MGLRMFRDSMPEGHRLELTQVLEVASSAPVPERATPTGGSQSGLAGWPLPGRGWTQLHRGPSLEGPPKGPPVRKAGP